MLWKMIGEYESICHKDSKKWQRFSHNNQPSEHTLDCIYREYVYNDVVYQNI